MSEEVNPLVNFLVVQPNRRIGAQQGNEKNQPLLELRIAVFIPKFLKKCATSGQKNNTKQQSTLSTKILKNRENWRQNLFLLLFNQIVKFFFYVFNFNSLKVPLKSVDRIRDNNNANQITISKT